MIYDHLVKFGDIIYKAGEEVPEKESPNPVIEDSTSVEEDTKKYSPEDLGNMTVKRLKELASELNIKLTKTAKKDIIEEMIAQM